MPLPRFDKLDEPRRRSILEAAAEEFGDRGFEGASYNRIIERAGISKGAMYYYFADKDDLFQTVLQVALTQWLTEVGYPFEADDASSFWSACHGMYARSMRFMLSDPHHAALCWSITRVRASHGTHPLVRELNAQLLEWIAALVEQGRVEELKAVNAAESRALAEAFLSRPFLEAQYEFLKSKGKDKPASLFRVLSLLHPIWSRLL